MIAREGPASGPARIPGRLPMTTRAKLLATAMLLGLCTEAGADIIT